jgi:hypothetical protein
MLVANESPYAAEPIDVRTFHPLDPLALGTPRQDPIQLIPHLSRRHLPLLLLPCTIQLRPVLLRRLIAPVLFPRREDNLPFRVARVSGEGFFKGGGVGLDEGLASSGAGFLHGEELGFDAFEGFRRVLS